VRIQHLNNASSINYDLPKNNQLAKMVRLLSAPPKTTNVKSGKPPKGFFFFAGRQWPNVTWWQKPNMRKLYFFTTILVMNNIAHGFDSSMSKFFAEKMASSSFCSLLTCEK
jgi:hypothetical protein